MSKTVKFGIGGECWFCDESFIKNVVWVGSTQRYVCSNCMNKVKK